MSTTASHQLEEIHAMLTSGHRSIRMERHTLILWGLAAAFLILTTEAIFTHERFPVFWQLIAAMNLYISSVLFATGVVDFRLTRRLRRERGESISFIQRQLTKVWWLLVGLIVVINIGMNFFGGGQLFYGICMILVGMALYIHGLFSQQMLTWGGIMLIVIGLATTAFVPIYEAQKYLAVSVFGLGLPLLSLMIDRRDITSVSARKLWLSSAWLLAVLAPALLAFQWLEATASNSRPGNAPLLALEEYSPSDTMQIVTLPAGTIVPFRLTINSELLSETGTLEIPLTLGQGLQLSVENDEVKGYYLDDQDETLKRLRINQLTLGALVSETRGLHFDMQMTIAAKQ